MNIGANIHKYLGMRNKKNTEKDIRNEEMKKKSVDLVKQADKNGVTAYRIGVGTGITENTIRNYIKDNTEPTLANAKVLIRYFSENPDALLGKTGDGEMLKTTSPPAQELTSETTPAILASNGYKMVPLYNFDAVGGMDSWNDVFDSPHYIEKYVPFAGAMTGDICIHVWGNSMSPVYNSGSQLLIRKVEGWMEYFGYGHCYVLLLRDGRRILKEIQKSAIDPIKNVLCVSFNPKHPQEELPRDFIVEVYKVIKTIADEGF